MFYLCLYSRSFALSTFARLQLLTTHVELNCSKRNALWISQTTHISERKWDHRRVDILQPQEFTKKCIDIVVDIWCRNCVENRLRQHCTYVKLNMILAEVGLRDWSRSLSKKLTNKINSKNVSKAFRKKYSVKNIYDFFLNFSIRAFLQTLHRNVAWAMISYHSSHILSVFMFTSFMPKDVVCLTVI